MTRLSLTSRTTRSLAVALLCLAPLAVVPAGCKLFRKTPLQSTVNTFDPHTAGQLVEGFYAVEAGAWRWTARQFSVRLKIPAGAAQKGATLRLSFTVPPAVIEKSGTITLTGSVEGSSLAPQTYSAPGDYTYRRNVPADLCSGSDTTVSFELDKAMTPDGPDKRSLGVVVSTIGLEPK
jgi:hypothetical protein